jgi:meiotic recombination protein SPO11
MNIFALVDFDPDGIAIMRTYKNGSRRLEHEQDATVPRLRWLGIHSDDILSSNASDHEEGVGSDGSGASQDGSSQESGAYSSYGTLPSRLLICRA